MLANKVEVPRLAVVNGSHVQLMAGPRRCPLPGSGSGRRDDTGRCSRRASRIRREGARTPGKRGRDRGISRSLDRPKGCPLWLALAGAADNRYTMEMLPALLQSKTPKLLVWGEDDGFQTVDYAERYAREIPETRLVRIKSAGHIPMENDPKAVAGALAEFFAAER